MPPTLEVEIRQPLQARSQRTLQRILDATEKLLEQHRFEEITIQDIVRRARSSIGSFYARFPGKEALLPALYDRHDQEVRARSVQQKDLDRARSLTLVEVTQEMISRLVERHRRRRWFMRAVALHARQHPEKISQQQRQRRQEIHRQWHALFLQHREQIKHPDPEQAVALGVFMVASTCREKIVFHDAPLASSVQLSDRRLAEELVRAFLAYLGVAAPQASRIA